MARKNTNHYPCEACGADLRFSPGQTRLVCDHCGHVQDIPPATGRGTAMLHELDLEAALRAELPELEMEDHRTVSCPNCAAIIELTGANHAAECPYCATPVVVDTGTHRLIKPQGVVPFVLTEAQARAAVGRWLGRLWFAPSGVAKYARRGRRMTGIYAPFWTFDAQTRSAYVGQRGTYYYETRTVTVRVDGRNERRQEEVRRIRWQSVAGRVARAFDDVLIYAARSLPPRYTDALKPWDLSALAAYRPDYLAGFEAEGYTVDLREGHYLARAEMAHVIASDVRRDIGGDEQRIDRIDTDFSDETFKHILLPVWTAAYRYRGRSYRFVVNGQTGRVQGDRPWSAWKIAFAVLLALILAGVVAYFNR
ncbi:TFIIB-type zinc ribbon-containing protein [Pontitalea aquivivens]|uniref:primosomal protein N' (replication factor Y) - superfamily II helicase n=1 Tax=Pontitalea aquivivens TaxID=3388663 RepID=UPI003970A286